jgi:sterol desaturase/sphingolipid hydroxylase (fatty acid hydroxylase superfamily)
VLAPPWWALLLACLLAFTVTHAVLLSVACWAGVAEAPRLRAWREGAGFVLAEAVLLASALRFEVVRLAPFALGPTLVVLAVGFAWWELWFYAGHRLLHTRAFWRFHAVHHGLGGLHPSLRFSAAETLLLSSGFYVPLSLASHAFAAVSWPTLAMVFAGAYALNVASHAHPASRFASSLSRRHSLHHAGARGHFGLVTPACDWLFGTHSPEGALGAVEAQPAGRARVRASEGATTPSAA